MNGTRHYIFWLLCLLLALAALYVLRPVLLPFVVGMAVAYLLDPVADRLESWGLSRTLATTVITVIFAIVAVVALVVLVPLLVDQIARFLTRVPDYFHALERWAQPTYRVLAAKLDHATRLKLGDAMTGFAGDAVHWAGLLVGEVLHGGAVALNLLSLIFITPVVTFYLLRDWDRMMAIIDGWLPRRQATTIHWLLDEIDRTIAGFMRGQAGVCLVLAIYYGFGLSMVGLDVGLIVGFGAGVLSFIPFLGAIVGFVIAMALAMVQFSVWGDIVPVALVFLVGQVLEGNVLTPKLVGQQVRLHPVWIMFSVLAGGTLFGFLGVLIAVPGAAVIGVLARFGMARYLEGPLHHDENPPAERRDGPA